jgi:hypothetical protein
VHFCVGSLPTVPRDGKNKRHYVKQLRASALDYVKKEGNKGERKGSNWYLVPVPTGMFTCAASATVGVP